MTIHAAVTSVSFRWFGQNDDVDVDRPIYKMTEPYEWFCTASINDVGNFLANCLC